MKGEKSKATPSSGSGSGSGNGPGSGFEGLSNTPGTSTYPYVKPDPFRIISQPGARYTDDAKDSGVEGPVRLKITLLATGNVGSVVAVTRLPSGLTENAMAAARRIVFLPKRVMSIPVSVVVTREYTFTIY